MKTKYFNSNHSIDHLFICVNDQKGAIVFYNRLQQDPKLGLSNWTLKGVLCLNDPIPTRITRKQAEKLLGKKHFIRILKEINEKH